MEANEAAALLVGHAAKGVLAITGRVSAALMRPVGLCMRIERALLPLTPDYKEEEMPEADSWGGGWRK